ncbi:MAG: SDR family oxidoreductase [bacterium]|nr:SDR family oxidoreductase [bacterium]MDZ4284650.1 SDR family oxidoreductase [Patescibacteria group bacterium]
MKKTRRASPIDKLFSLSGKTAVITGGCGMLGIEYATILAEAGARVVLLDMLPPRTVRARLETLPASIRTRVDGRSIDITDESRVKKTFKDILNKYQTVDILVNNAALTDFSDNADRWAAYENFSLPLWSKELEVSLTGSFLCTRAVMPQMKKARSGVIVNISSIYGLAAPDNRIYKEGVYRSLAYATAKSGIMNFTRSLASYLSPHGIRVNTLSLGGVFADHDEAFVTAYAARTMLGRMARKEEYRGPLLFLCSDASAYMTGSNLVVDGGWTAW